MPENLDLRPRIYISGPITAGNRNRNYFQAVEAERQLMLAGFAPLNPMATMCLPFAWEDDFPHGLWLECDFAWIAVADAVLRLPGYSVGADAELQFAGERDIPIFYGIDELLAWKETLGDARCTNESTSAGQSASASASG